MGRRKRPHAPGMVFHLVSRLHRREPWFVPELRGDVATLIRRIVGRTDAGLLAYAVMPTHLHVVVRQGRSPLAAVMQPLLRRLAHRVQAHHGFEGAVVERRYRDRLCGSPEHVRAAILYVHLNPWRAGLCDEDLGYPWTTHPAYVPGSDPTEFGIHPGVQHPVLELFGQGGRRSRHQLCDDYQAWLQYRMFRDLQQSCETDDAAARPAPAPRPRPGRAQDVWRLEFGPGPTRPGIDPGRPMPDLNDYIASWLSRSEYDLGDLRGSWLPRPAARFRARAIRAAADRGYRTGRIAELFDVSPTTVSKAKYRPEAR